MEPIKPSTLVHGSNIISKYLRYCLVPIGFVYRFDSRAPYRPKPLTILVLLFMFSPLISYLTIYPAMLNILKPRNHERSDSYKAMASSVFIVRTLVVTSLIRFVLVFAVIMITLSQHGCISNVVASGNNYLTEKEQVRFAKVTFLIFCMDVFWNTAAYPTSLAISARNLDGPGALFYISLITLTLSMVWIRMHHCSPLIYACYLGASLGRHVENFSAIYIDTMFDQFMRAIEKEGDDDQSSSANPTLTLSFFENTSDQDDSKHQAMAHLGHRSFEKEMDDELKARRKKRHGAMTTGWRLISRLLAIVFNLFKSMIIRLSMRRYPELPEMKMTKLSSTTKIQISERTRSANNHLIRVRLRRTQIMLSDLRDLVSDINRTSSPILLVHIILETILTILVTTASVQAKAYKSVSPLILPTFAITISMVLSVIYICVCLDETTKQLRLLINKLFDFIIMNHRVQSSGRHTERLQMEAEDDQVCVLPGSELGAINETWSQFQYTRKLANTIQFTMGGIVPVTRRLVLSILGHILSAVFISIEIMSIIDTMNTPHSGATHSTTSNRHSNHTMIGHHHSNHLERHQRSISEV